MHDFLTHVSDEADAERFRVIRSAYLPGMIICYTSALSFAGTFISRDHFFKALDLAPIITSDENKELVEAFTEAKMMAAFTETLGRANKQLLRMNELAMLRSENGEARAAKRRKVSGMSWRNDEGKTLDIWDIGGMVDREKQ